MLACMSKSDPCAQAPLLAENRLVTLTGAGGVGKTRLAARVEAALAGQYGDGVRYVAPLTDPDLVTVTVARALGLPDRGCPPLATGLPNMLLFARWSGGRHGQDW